MQPHKVIAYVFVVLLQEKPQSQPVVVTLPESALSDIHLNMHS